MTDFAHVQGWRRGQVSPSLPARQLGSSPDPSGTTLHISSWPPGATEDQLTSSPLSKKPAVVETGLGLLVQEKSEQDPFLSKTMPNGSSVMLLSWFLSFPLARTTTCHLQSLIVGPQLFIPEVTRPLWK